MDNTMYNGTTSSFDSKSQDPYVGYNNITYKGRVDAEYANTGPDYNPQTNNIDPLQQTAVNNVRGFGYDDLANRFEEQAMISNKHSGNHSDQPTYGRESIYRTASDTVTYDAYKSIHKNEIEPAKAALAEEWKHRNDAAGPDLHLRIAAGEEQLIQGHSK